MEGITDLFSGGGEGPSQQAPSPVVLPDVRFDFGRHIDPQTGEVIAIILQLWISSAPMVRFVLPFDRLSFADFVKQARQQITLEGMNGDG